MNTREKENHQMKRLTAVRATISDIVTGTYGDDNGAHVTSSYGVELRRVVLVGFVVSKFTSEPEEGKKRITSITLDDGTETIRINVFGEEDSALLQGVKKDILVLVIGKVRKSKNPNYDEEVYIIPEIVKEIKDPNYMTLHLMERYQAILTRSGISTIDEDQQDLTTIIGEPTRTKIIGLAKEILDYIEEHATPDGITLDDIVAHFEKKGKDSIEIQKKIFVLVADDFISEKTPERFLPVK